MDLRKSIEEIIKTNKGNVGVVVKNLNSKDTIMINERLVFPSASTIKLVIMSQVLKEVKEKKHSLKEIIKLVNTVKTGGDGILKELNEGHEFTLEEIMTLMIILSDNTATNILISLVGMESINSMALELGLRNTKLQRKMMDSAAARSGRENLTCAEDMARILELIYEGKNVDSEYSGIMLEILKKQQVRGRLDLYLPDDTLIAHKTGDLDKLEHDVGIVFLPGCTYIICVLTNETETNKDGREIIGKISKAVYEAYKR